MIRGGSALMAWGVGVENLIARNSPDMLGGKTGTKITKKIAPEYTIGTILRDFFARTRS